MVEVTPQETVIELEVVKESDSDMAIVTVNPLPEVDALLAQERTGIVLESAVPLVAPEKLGATAGVAYTASDPNIWVSVYDFEHADDHANVVKELNKHLPNPDLLVETTSNGSLLFFGYAQKTGDPIEDMFHPLVTLVSSFAGEE